METLLTASGTHYTDLGSGPAVVLVHALGLNTSLWSVQVPVLAQRYRVIRYDVRGHGLTPFDGKPFTLQSLAEDLGALLDHLGIERAAIVGISMGGMIAQAFAIAQPARAAALGLISTVSGFPQAGREGLLHRARTVEVEGMEPMVEPAIERWFTEEFRARAQAGTGEPGGGAQRAASSEIGRRPAGYEASMLSTVGRMMRAADPMGYAACCRALAEADLTPDLGDIECPALVMSGENDPGVTAESQAILAANIERSTQVVVPNSSHLIPIEQAEEFNSRLLSFLSWWGYL